MTPPSSLPDPGLCRRCAQARTVASRRSTFLACGRAAADPTFPRYPRLPVLACPGFEPVAAPASAPDPTAND